MSELLIPSAEEIMAINRKFNGGAKKGELDFIISKIKSSHLTDDSKKDIAKAAATLWYYIIQNHVFVDGNKRTATETVKLFCKMNKFDLDFPPNGFIYISLKIANSDIAFQELVQSVYEKLRRGSA